MNQNELYHHGVKGMKWGVRRYQNKNGRLTPAGKKRYYEESSVVNAKDKYDTAKKQYNKAYITYNVNPTNKNLKSMNDAKSQLDYNKFNYQTKKETARIAEKSVTFKNKSKHRTNLEEHYKKAGLSDKEAEAAANNRIKTEKLLAAAAGITVTACAAYAANTYVKNRTDQLLKSGYVLQRIEMQDTGGKLYDTFYAASGKHDSKRYANLLGMARQQQAGHAYMMKLEVNKDIKVASKDKAAKVFGDLYKNDPEFREIAKNYTKRHFGGANIIWDVNDLSDRNIKKMYDNFNSNLIHIRSDEKGIDKKFYDKLKSEGYAAIQDINDMKYSGYRAKNPLIIFDNSNDNIMVKSFNEIEKNMLGAGLKELLKAQAEGEVQKLAPLSAIGLTGAAAGTYITKPNIPKVSTKKKRKNKKR